MTPKTLEEFIGPGLNAFLQKTTEDWLEEIKRVKAETAAEILRVAIQNAWDVHEEYYAENDKPLMVVNISDLENYIQPVKKESE